MRLLLDTHILLWAAGAPDKLPARAHALLSDPAQVLYFSAASLWEIAIKNGLGRSDFAVDVPGLYTGLVGAGYLELPIKAQHAMAITGLPALHKDPFDRILLAQAQYENLLLVTADSVLARYPGPVLPV